jgi:hypothetical protein
MRGKAEAVGGSIRSLATRHYLPYYKIKVAICLVRFARCLMEANDYDSISEELLAVDVRWVDARLQEIKEFVQKRLQDIWGLLFAEVS